MTARTTAGTHGASAFSPLLAYGGRPARRLQLRPTRSRTRAGVVLIRLGLDCGQLQLQRKPRRYGSRGRLIDGGVSQSCAGHSW